MPVIIVKTRNTCHTPLARVLIPENFKIDFKYSFSYK